MLAASRRGLHGHRRRLDEGARSATAAGGSQRFVGGHPIAGAEARGPEHAKADIFRGRDLVPDPARRHRPAALPAACTASSRSLGAVPVAVDPHAHDRLVALTSHVPHVLANLIVNHAGASRIEGHEPLAAAGGSLRDMTRVAGANPRIWVDIFLDNAEAIREALAEHRRRVEQVESRARRVRRRLPRALDRRGGRATAAGCSSRSTPTPATLQRLRVHVPDRPGVLAGITQALGAERINIEDFELHHYLARARRRARDPDRAASRRPRAPRRCSSRRATASSSRRCSDDASSSRSSPHGARRRDLASPATSRSRTASVLLGAIADGEVRITGFGRSGRHRVVDRAPCARSAPRSSRRTSTR